MDLLSRSVKRAGQKIDLQPREFRLLEYLMRHGGQVVTRTMLLEGVWIIILTHKRTSSMCMCPGCGRRSTSLLLRP